MASYAELSSAQIGNDMPQLFSNTGNPTQVFVDPGGIINRPKLVRALKRFGALICSDPRSAEIILVDSDSHTGRQFIQDWSKDSSKSVLEYTWVRKSIEAGRALLATDNYGGCGTHDDGLHIGEESSDSASEQVKLNPLPTPRPSPTDPQPPLPATDDNLAFPLSHAHARPRSPYSTLQSNYRASISGPESSSASSTLVNRSQPEQNETSVLFSEPQINPPQQQTINFLPPQNVIQYASAGMQPGNIPLLQIPMPDMGLPAGGPFVGQLAQTQLFILEALRNGSWNVPIPQLYNNMAQNAYYNHPQQSGISGASYGSDMTAISNSISSSLHTSLRVDDDARRTASSPQSDLHDTQSAQHRTSSHTSRSKGKERAPRKNHSRGNLPVDDSTSGHIRNSQPAGIFTSASGRESLFFVQIDIPKRIDLVTKIKKNGGKIAADLALADYVVLNPRSAKSFNNLQNAAAAADKPAISAAFVDDCCEEQVLLDITEYLFGNDVPKPKPVGYTAEMRQKRAADLEKHEREEVKRDQKEKTRHHKKRKTGSPSPPPAHSRMQRSDGRFTYTTEETEFALDYIRILLERDISTSRNDIAVALFAKMPHHSLLSWQSMVTRKLRDDIEDAREKVVLAQRKAERRARREQRRQERSRTSNDEDLAPFRLKKSSSPVELPDSEIESVTMHDLEQEDFSTICNFFANVADDSLNDDALWAKLLEDQGPCKTDDSWLSFYEHHLTAVDSEVQRLADAAYTAATRGVQENMHGDNERESSAHT